MSSREIGNRWPELAVGGLLFAIGLVVVLDSWRVGVGWSDDGPRSGTFPFYVGALLLAASGTVVVGQLLRWRRDAGEVFATRGQLGLVAQVAVPIVVYVGAITMLGIYVASALMIAWFMAVLGRYRWTRVLPVALGVPVLAFVVFERWFLVPLAKGPLEQWLGL